MTSVFLANPQSSWSSEKATILNDYLKKSNFDVEVITKGLNTYEKNFQNCHLKLNYI